MSLERTEKLTFHVNTQGKLVDLVQREVTNLLQSALDVALSVVRANPDVLEGLGAQLEGNPLPDSISLFAFIKREQVFDKV